ncbi:hypothetical protein KC363_g1274 [Hortaea werneckii]|nr:hypothetical protein KC361_g2880 [Hortaea werneckii]KAI6885174.1 hypothetical protein KC325_g3731 [Hortaea werneckii]KAI7142402.1 hypothetical protein KC344_g7206 [Hortaea werneckii]KAI7175170.1 hypothetical protein KC360_g3825 [Hortaea werneckii]KAI7195783.1 hypothetical protein KC363_g1274 [Hortaea werneckii]
MSTASKHSPLLALPKELRLVIYDELFTPLTQRPKHFDTYVLPSEWPRIDFTSYRALLLTCKEVKEEATTHFEGHFLRDVMVYFDNVVDLRNFYFKIKRASDPEKLADYYTEYIQMVAPIGCLGGHEGLLPCQSYEENALDGKEEGTGGCLWPGTKEYEQELKKKYVLDA